VKRKALVVLLFSALALVGANPAAAALPRKERAAITATLDRFLVDAVARKNVAAAWDLMTPAGRGGVTRAQWNRGELPVYPYPLRGTHFPGWTLDYAYPNDVALDVLVQPRNPKKDGAVAYSVELKKLHGRWLVDSLYVTAQFAPPGHGGRVKATNDFTAPGAAPDNGSDKARLGHVWTIVPLSVFGGIVLVPLALFGAHWYRDRRATRRYGAR
jgi:hypothetical protein